MNGLPAALAILGPVLENSIVRKGTTMLGEEVSAMVMEGTQLLVAIANMTGEVTEQHVKLATVHRVAINVLLMHYAAQNIVTGVTMDEFVAGLPDLFGKAMEVNREAVEGMLAEVKAAG